MREIKFRFFRTKKKEMVYGFENCSTTYVLGLWENEKHVSEPMQYTGLKDKNGREIYEQDVLRDNDTLLWRVFYEDGMFMVRGGDYDLTEALMEFVPEHCEVIGNIYENPELSKGAKQ